MDRRGVPTATGEGRWSAWRVKAILTNPKYCGEGRNLRYHVEWKDVKNEHTGRVREVQKVHDRLRELRDDPER